MNGLLKAEQLPDDAAETDFSEGDRLTVYLRDRSNTDATDARDVDLEFVLAPRTVAERYSPAAAEPYAASHREILPGEDADETTPAVTPDPEEELDADPDAMLLDPPEEVRASVTPTSHARDRYASRVRCPESDRPSLEAAWRSAVPVDPKPFAEADGDGGAPDAVRYAPELNVAFIRRGERVRTVLHGFGFSYDMVATVKTLGHDPKPGEDSVRVPTSEQSVRPAVRPVLDAERQTDTASVTDSRARNPPGFIDEWPAPDPRPPVDAVGTTAVVRRVPRAVPEKTAPAIERLPPEPRTPPGAVETEAAVKSYTTPTATKGSPETEALSKSGNLRSFDRVREELDRLEAAGHDVTGLRIEDVEAVCADCGLVVSIDALERKPGLKAHAPEGSERDGEWAVEPTKELQVDKGLHTTFFLSTDGKGNTLSPERKDKMERLRRRHKRFTMHDKRDKRLNEGFRDIGMLGANLELPEHVTTDASRYLEAAKEARLPGGRMAWESLAAGAVLLAGRKAGVERTPAQIAEHAKTSRERVCAAVRKIRVQTDVDVPPVRDRAVGRVVAALDDELDVATGIDLVRVAERLMDVTDREAIAPGTARMTVAGAAVYAADRLTDGKAVTQADVVRAVEATVPTSRWKISNYSRELHDASERRHQPTAAVAGLVADD